MDFDVQDQAMWGICGVLCCGVKGRSKELGLARLPREGSAVNLGSLILISTMVLVSSFPSFKAFVLACAKFYIVT